MTNASLTTIKQEYDLTTESGLIRLAQDAGRDFKTKMMIVVEYWLKPVSEGGQGGTVRSLADKLNKAERTIRKYATVLRKQGRVPAHCNSRPQGAAPVENLSTKVSTPPTTTTFSQSTDDSVSEPLQPLHTMGCELVRVQDVQPYVATYSEGSREDDLQMDPADPSSFLARDWHNVQQSDASESFKRAHELLCEFEVLLGQSRKDGWTPPQFYQLATTLNSYHRSCSNCSAEYREELRQYGETRFAAVARALEGDTDAR